MENVASPMPTAGIQMKDECTYTCKHTLPNMYVHILIFFWIHHVFPNMLVRNWIRSKSKHRIAEHFAAARK